MELQFSLTCDLLFKSHERELFCDSLFISFLLSEKWKDLFLLFLSHPMEFNDKEVEPKNKTILFMNGMRIKEKLKEMSKGRD